MPVFTPHTSGVHLSVRVTPRAGKNLIAGVRDDVVLVKLAAAPVDGAANEALIGMLADAFDLSKRDIQIVAGNKSRTKRVQLAGVSVSAMDARLAALLEG